MVKKIHNPLKIDYKNCIIEDKLLQVKNFKNNNTPDLIPVWTLQINPRDSKKIIELIRSLQDKDPISLQHLKRIQKTKDNKFLCVVIFSKEYIEDKDQVMALLQNNDIKYNSISDNVLVPRFAPMTKELVHQWGKKYWPLTWNGNPNDQILNDYVINMDSIKNMLQKIANLSEREYTNGNKFPVVTAFVDPINNNVEIVTTDKRSCKDGFALDHSIMLAIKKVSKLQKMFKENKDPVNMTSYLCLNYDVYTTHEPCSMCAMALVHSRVKRCIFIKPMSMTGALRSDSGDGYSLHDTKVLNSKYEVFQWLGDEYANIPELDPNVCC